jgi:hypothetical protein
MKWGVSLIVIGAFVVAAIEGCTRQNPLHGGLQPGETCSGQQFCTIGTYALCQVGDHCRYLASDGSGFTCASCSSCAGAQLAAAQWCLGVGGTNGGNTNSGTTNGGTTNGGTTNGGTTNGGGTNGGTTGGTQTCDQCALDAQNGVCAASVDACFNDPECADLATCIQGCSTDTCQLGCFDMASSTARSEYNQAADCNCGQCAALCSAECTNRVRGGSTTGGTSGGSSGGSGGSSGGSGGSSGGTGGTTGGNACTTCSAAATSVGTGACSSESLICTTDTACFNYANCLHGCSSTACRQQCAQTAGSTAVTEYNNLGTCICDNCSACSC